MLDLLKIDKEDFVYFVMIKVELLYSIEGY